MTRPNLFTPDEAAKLLKVSARTVLNWIRDGRIKAQNYGRLRPVYRISRAELIRLGALLPQPPEEDSADD